MLYNKFICDIFFFVSATHAGQICVCKPIQIFLITRAAARLACNATAQCKHALSTIFSTVRHAIHQQFDIDGNDPCNKSDAKSKVYSIMFC
jgi:hypothetical protein